MKYHENKKNFTTYYCDCYVYCGFPIKTFAVNYKGYDISVGENTNILSYIDFDEISEYAIEAMQYAFGSVLMKGKTETTLNPIYFATRAEIAAILQRFIEGNK